MTKYLLRKFCYHLTILFAVHDLCIYQISANKCDEDLFYRPYVEVKKKKNGGDLASLRSSGFLDLRYRNRVLLCMNGPVVLYSDVERLDPEARLQPENDKSKDTLQSAPEARNPSPDHSMSADGMGEEELRFRKGELMVFNHQCISINKIPTNFLKKMKEDQGRSNPEIMPDTQVMGRLVLGVFLIGDKESYQNPELAWFKGTNLDYIKTKDKTVKDSSFIIANSKTSHCLRLPDGTHVKISGPRENNGTIDVCRWTVREEDKHWYAKVFQRGYDANGIRNGEETLEESDYEFYECPDGDPDRNIILTMSKTTPEPISHANYTEFDPFSLFNPNIWTPHGYRRDSNGLSGGDERSEDKQMSSGVAPEGGDVPCSLDPSTPGCGENEDIEETTLKDMQNVDPITSTAYEIIAGDCIPLPEFDMATCDGIGDNGNRILELVLELIPIVGPCDNMTVPPAGPPAAAGAPAPPAGKRRKRDDPASGNVTLITEEEKQTLPDCGNLCTNENLKWKMDILYLVSEIFSHLCMPFRADFPYTVARVFAWYVMRAHSYGENMGRVDPGTNVPMKDISDQFDHLIKQTDTWIILSKELERCAAVAKNENGGKGIKFQWEVGEETGKWKIPAVDGRPTRRRKRSLDQSEYPTYGKRQSSANKLFKGEERSARKKRATNHSRPVLSNKYILPGKSMTPVKSEGTAGYAREVIQEYRPKPDLNDPRADAAKYCDYPENIQHCWHPQEDPVNKQIVCSKTEDIFFYEDRAEIEYELNIAIDLWWKIWGTVIGYCNKAYHSRKSETFPRLYNSKYEYFFELVQKEWKQPQDNEDLKIIFSEYLTEENHIWLDSCLEASYINSNSHSYRPPRPMSIEENSKEVSNYFEEVPTYLYYRYHPEPNVAV